MFSRSTIRSQTPPPSTSDSPSSRAGDGSALWSSPKGFTFFACPAVPLSGAVCLLRSSRELLKVLSLLTFGPSHLTAVVLWPRLTPAASAQPRDWGYHLRWPANRSPQVRTLTLTASLPHLLHQLLIASGFIVFGQLTQLAQPRMGFVSLKSQFRFRLPSDLASRRRPCLPLTVGAISLRRGLSPPSQRPCWAHRKTARSH